MYSYPIAPEELKSMYNALRYLVEEEMGWPGDREIVEKYAEYFEKED